MTTLLNAAKQALEALVCLEEDGSYLAKNAASALRTAIQEAEQQEPVAWFDPDSGLPFGWTEEPPTPGAIFLYTTPQPPAAKEWQGLTDEDFSGGMDQLRALITEAVGIVQGEVVAWKCLNGTLMEEKPKFIGEPLHHNDLGRLK